MKKLIVFFLLMTFGTNISFAKMLLPFWIYLVTDVAALGMMAYKENIPAPPVKWSCTENGQRSDMGSGYWTVRGYGTITNNNDYKWTSSQFKWSVYESEAKTTKLYSTTFDWGECSPGKTYSWDTSARVIYTGTIAPDWGELELVSATGYERYWRTEQEGKIQDAGQAILITSLIVMSIDIYKNVYSKTNNSTAKLSFYYDNSSIGIKAAKYF